MKGKLYSDIHVKLGELIELNGIEPVYEFGDKNPESLKNIMKKQDRLMNELKELARKHNTVLGRVIKFPMADSHAYYVVSNIMGSKVEVTCLRYCDAWQDDRIGSEGMLRKSYVVSRTHQEDLMDELFSRKTTTVEIPTGMGKTRIVSEG